MPINSNLVHTFYSSHINAEDAFKVLHNNHFNRKKLPEIHKLYQTQEDAAEGIISQYNLSDHIFSWGRFGAVCGWIWGMGFGVAFSIVPGVDPIMDGGPIAGWLVGALGSAVVLGSLSAFSAMVFGSLLSIHWNSAPKTLSILWR